MTIHELLEKEGGEIQGYGYSRTTIYIPFKDERFEFPVAAVNALLEARERHLQADTERLRGALARIIDRARHIGTSDALHLASLASDGLKPVISDAELEAALNSTPVEEAKAPAQSGL